MRDSPTRIPGATGPDPLPVTRDLGGRPILAAIAIMNAITGLAVAAVLAPVSFGGDVDFLRRGALGLQSGTPVPDFVFTPLCAVVAVPLAHMPPTLAALTMTLIELTLLLVGLARETRALERVDRALIAIAVVGFLPVVNELLLGQVTLLIAASIYPLRERDGPSRGVAAGFMLALVPKPLVVPLLLWMLLWRRRALAAAVTTAALLTLMGVVVIGPGAYGSWIDALGAAGRVSRSGSLSLWASGLTPLAVLLAAVAIAGLGWCLNDPRRGLAAALLAGLLLAPYTLLYAASILLLAVRPTLEVSPRAGRILALVANPALLGAPAAWMAAGLLAMSLRRLILPPPRTPRGIDG